MVVGESHDLVVKQMAHNQEVVGSNPGTVYWMDVSDASYSGRRLMGSRLIGSFG